MTAGANATMRVYSSNFLSSLANILGWRLRRLPPQTTIPPRALSAWNERPDLQETFDLRQEGGRENLAWWYLQHGFSELGLSLKDCDNAFLQDVTQTLPQTGQLSFLPISWLMAGIATPPLLKGSRRKNLGRSAEKQEALLSWFFAVGLMRANLSGFLTDEQAQILLTDHPQHPGVPRILACIWSTQPDLHDRFASLGDPGFREWCQKDGARQFPILSHPLIGFASPPTRRSHHLKPFGVNLFGHAHGRSGVSEDVRMAARVLAEAAIPFTIHNVPPGPGMPDEHHVEIETNNGDFYAINMFTMTAQATAIAVTKLNPALLHDCYNIGFWPWELPEVPEFWKHTYRFVDEIWASSRFTYDAFCRSCPKPVRHVPFAVAADESDNLDRADFGLPEHTFLFGFAFDGLSSFSRKAPLATIQAFQRAFPEEDRSVGLVIKGLRVADSPQWQSVAAAAGGDDRIHLITQSLPRGGLLDLWRALDCFVSLHRSEGFGRNIAETMLLGKPAIVTAHSGNMDFTRHDTAALVPCTLRAVQAGEYPFAAGQLWAEPDIAAAAAQMKTIAADKEWREKIGQSGSNAIVASYATDVIGRLWGGVLREIYDG